MPYVYCVAVPEAMPFTNDTLYSQERFRTTIKGYPAVIDAARRLVRGAAALEIPIICTEQYPKALGSTVQEVLEVLPDACKPVPKTDFTMLGESTTMPS